MFRRQETTYRLAILASHWLRNTADYKPSAVEDARGLWINVVDNWITFIDIADQLATDPIPLASELALNQLHTAIRAPLEMLRSFCRDCDKANGRPVLCEQLRATEWYVYATAIRNAVSHDFHFRFDSKFIKLLPVTWGGVTITREHNGQKLAWDTFGHKRGYELLMAMQEFASALPDQPTAPRGVGYE